MGKDEQNNPGGDGFADCVRRLHQSEGFAAMFRAPRLGDQSGGGTPFSAHTETEKKSKNRELRN